MSLSTTVNGVVFIMQYYRVNGNMTCSEVQILTLRLEKSFPGGLIITAVCHQTTAQSCHAQIHHIIYVPPPLHPTHTHTHLSGTSRRSLFFQKKGNLEICLQASINISTLTTLSSDSLGFSPVFAMNKRLLCI